MRRLPPLARLRTFELAARLQSFAAAAEALNLTASAVSHQMRELEQHFGLPLFERRHRRVQTTAAGERLAQNLKRVFDALEAACAEVALPAQDEVLAVHCAPSLAIKWLGPRLPAFVAAHPALNVRLSTGAEALDLALAREVDVLLSYGAPPAPRPGIEVLALGAERLVPLVAPALKPPRIRATELLQRLPLIDSTLSPLGWPAWFERQGLPLPPRPRPAFDRAAMAIAAAADGLGITLESTRLAARELERGELVELGAGVFEPVALELHHLSLRSSDRRREAVAAFAEWVIGQATAAPRTRPRR